MAGMAELTLELTVRDGEGRVVLNEPRKTYRWTPSSLLPKREAVSLTGSASSTLTVPSGAKFLMVLLGSAVSITAEGASGDTGIAITPASAPTQVPALIPLGTSPSVVLTNGSGSAQTVHLLWL